MIITVKNLTFSNTCSEVQTHCRGKLEGHSFLPNYILDHEPCLSPEKGHCTSVPRQDNLLVP